MPTASIETLAQLYERPGFMLRRAHQISVAIFEESCAALELSPAQYAILVALHAMPGATQVEVARAVGMNKVTASQVVKALEARGWVRRKAVDGDRRCWQLFLTRSGKNALLRANGLLRKAYDTLMAPFDAKERKLFRRLLGKLIRELDGHARAPMERAG